MASQYNRRILFTRIIFPFAYAGFFAVQFFINFDTTLGGSPDRYQVIQCRVQGNFSSDLLKAKDNLPVKTKFRLNKRFQPSAIPVLPDLNYVLAISDISETRLFYANPIITDPLLDIHLLRGPPFDMVLS